MTQNWKRVQIEWIQNLLKALYHPQILIVTKYSEEVTQNLNAG